MLVRASRNTATSTNFTPRYVTAEQPTRGCEHRRSFCTVHTLRYITAYVLRQKFVGANQPLPLNKREFHLRPRDTELERRTTT